MKFSSYFIDRTRESNDIVDLIGSVTPLKSRNLTDFHGRCPFPEHNDSNPSFCVSRAKQVYHCFGCGKSGNIFTFLQDHEGLSFPESVEFLARKAGIPLPPPQQSKKNGNRSGSGNEDDKIYQQEQAKKQQLYKIQELALAFFQKNLLQIPDGHPIRNYIQQRRLANSTLKDFKIGYAPREWNQLSDKIKTQGFSMNLACQSGLIKKAKNGNYFDVFRNRLMFPIFSTIGDCIGFGGRSLDKESQPKYINSSNSLIFHKGKHPYHGPALSLSALRQKNQVILVEGYMDLIQLHQAGIKNVLATLGTALTEDHCKSIKKFSQQVLVVFDGDQAGQEAAKKSLSILLSSGLYPRILFLAENQDPDDYLQHLQQKGLSSKKILEHLEEKISSAPDLFTYLLEKKLQLFKGRPLSPIEKTDLTQKLAPLFASMKDTHLRQMYLKETAFKMGIENVSELQQMLRKASFSSNFPSSFAPRIQNQGYKQGQAQSQVQPQSPAQPQVHTHALQSNSKVPLARNLEEGDREKHPQSNEETFKETFGCLQLQRLHSSELYILVFCLHSEKCLRVAMECEISHKITHPQLKALFRYIHQKFQQSSSTEVPKILSWLSSHVDKAELLYSPKRFFYPDGRLNETKANALFMDSIIIIQKRFLEKELKNLRIQSRQQSQKNDNIKKFQEIKEKLDKLNKKHTELQLITL